MVADRINKKFSSKTFAFLFQYEKIMTSDSEAGLRALDVKLIWVLGHADVAGNQEADSLTKDGRKESFIEPVTGNCRLNKHLLRYSTLDYSPVNFPGLFFSVPFLILPNSVCLTQGLYVYCRRMLCSDIVFELEFLPPLQFDFCTISIENTGN